MSRSVSPSSRWRNALVAMAIAAMSAPGLAGCGSGTHQSKSSVHLGAHFAASSTPMIAVAGSPVSVPAELPGYVPHAWAPRTFGTHEVALVDFTQSATGGGPAASGSGLTFAVFRDQPEHDALVAKNMAARQLAYLDSDGRPAAPRALILGRHTVAFWPTQSRYELPASGDWVVQVNNADVDPRQVQQLIAGVVG